MEIGGRMESSPNSDHGIGCYFGERGRGAAEVRRIELQWAVGTEWDARSFFVRAKSSKGASAAEPAIRPPNSSRGCDAVDGPSAERRTEGQPKKLANFGVRPLIWRPLGLGISSQFRAGYRDYEAVGGLTCVPLPS